MSFGARILLAMVAILVVTVAGSIVASDRWLRPRLEATLAREMRIQVRVAALALPREPDSLAAAADTSGGS